MQMKTIKFLSVIITQLTKALYIYVDVRIQKISLINHLKE